MTRTLRAALAALVLVATALPAAALVSLSEASAYFNGFQTAQAQFTQIAGDGTISTGTLYIHRPGRMRFEYDPPTRQLVIAGGQQVAIFDGRSNAGPEQYPLNRTPLSIILAETVNLNQSNMVTRHVQDGQTTVIRAQDPRNPQYGNIELVFTDGPVALRQWVVTDNTGSKTTVILGELRRGVGIAPRLFSIPDAAARWN